MVSDVSAQSVVSEVKKKQKKTCWQEHKGGRDISAAILKPSRWKKGSTKKKKKKKR